MSLSFQDLIILLAAVFTVGASACGEAEESPEAEGCEHRRAGPNATATAAIDAATATAVTLEHTNVTVTLSATDRTIKFEADEAGDFRLFLDVNVPITVRTDAGVTVALESSVTTIEECPDLIAAYHQLELSPGFYSIELGGTETTVNIVLAPVEGDAHGD